MTPDDRDDLHSYCARHCADAFRRIVTRHLDLVYSAALRQTRAPHLAQEVAQSVFIELSRAAARVRTDLPLNAWLYTVTRRKAIDLVRRETSRHAREQAAAALQPSASHLADSADWQRLTDLLDDAMMDLGEKDRSAILLRFFANQPLREIGATLGASDDATQKRIARALDRLRASFSRRGLAVGATTLASALSAHAVHTAPVALTTTIASAALLVPPAAVAGVATLLAMSGLQKILAVSVVTAVTAAGLYQAHTVSRQRSELDQLRLQHARLGAALDEAQARRLAAEKELAASDRLLARADEILTARARQMSDAARSSEADIQSWTRRQQQLKAWAARHPERTIPEMSLLTDSDWLEATREVKLDTEEDARQALSTLRKTAKAKLRPLFREAMQAYQAAHPDSLPDHLSALAPYFNPPLDPRILARYEVRAPDPADPQTNDQFIAEKQRVDDEYDTLIRMDRHGRFSVRSTSVFVEKLQTALQAYKNAHDGAAPAEFEQLADYFATPLSPAELERLKRVRSINTRRSTHQREQPTATQKPAAQTPAPSSGR